MEEEDGGEGTSPMKESMDDKGGDKKEGDDKSAAKESGGKKDKGPQIEVVDPDGKVVETYPDAFGDDTATIIKLFRQLHDIKDDKGGEKKKGKDDKKSKAKDDDKSEGKGEGDHDAEDK